MAATVAASLEPWKVLDSGFALWVCGIGGVLTSVSPFFGLITLLLIGSL